MNYLAHLFFAKNTQFSLLGNLMGDFVKGDVTGLYNTEIIDGILQHRLIDKYTDTHHIVKISKNRISKQRKRFSGILIIDIFYDHFLSVHWQKYSNENYNDTINYWYKNLNMPTAIDIPKNLQLAIQNMTQHNLLESYLTLDGIEQSVNRVSNRIRFKNNMNGGIEELTNNYKYLEKDFLIFFPQLIQYVREINK